jgi:hypothetical protein
VTGKGPNLAGKIADTVTRAHIATKLRMAPETVRVAMQIQEAFFSLTGEEHKSTSGGWWRDLLATGKLTGPAADTALFLADGHGQWQTLLAGTATGAAMGGGILDLITNEFAPAIQALLYNDPNMLLAPTDAAAAVARGIIDYPAGELEAGKGAISPARFKTLWELNRGIPSPEELRELTNRGLLNEADAQHAIERGGLDGRWSQSLMALRHALLSPEQLAALVTFGVLSEAAAAKMAAQSGTSAEDFHLLVLGNGQPPSSEELLFAYRRGIIDKARLLKGITQGPIRNEWFDVIESLGQVPMSTADAVEASIQGHLSKGEAQKIAAQNGLLPAQFEPLWQTAGSPPGGQEMLHWLNRGLMTEAEVRQGLTESRLKPKYVDLLIRSRAALPPMTTIRSAFAKGAITHVRALKLLSEHGYSAEDADMILAAAHAEKTATIRHLTESQVVELYTDRAIGQGDAHDMLSALGYDDTDIAWILEIADLKRTRAHVSAALSKIRSEYVGRHIDENGAQGAMDVLLIPPDQRDDLLALWDIERSVVTKQLTLAQATAAFKRGIIGQGDFTDRVAAMGYAAADVQILLALAAPAGP